MDRRPAAVERRLNELARRCRETGMNLTAQRIAVFRALILSEDHPTPERLFERVRAELPTLSLATIYKTLDSLEALGLIARVSPLGDGKRYEANDQPHHHLICTRCHKIVDFTDEHYDALKPPRRLDGFTIESLTVQLKGLCPSCRKT
jgi:Fur family peroxide stress response transcriptional regulator